MSSARDYLQLVRAPAVFTAISNIAAAHLVATRGQIEWTSLVTLCAASAALLAAGMALNDCFDLEIDRRERPSRPLPSGRVAVRAAWTLGWALLAAGVALAALVGERAMLIAALLAGAIVLYNGAAKAGRLGPYAMGLCRYLNWLLGLSIAPLTSTALLIPLPMFFYIGAVTQLSRAESNAEDQQQITFAQIFLVLAILCFVALSVAGIYPVIWVLAPAFIAGVLGWRLLERTRRQFSPPQVQAAVGRLLLGIIPLDVLMALANGIWWSLVLLLLMLPGKWLGRRLYVT